jgi:hypothetical protein
VQNKPERAACWNCFGPLEGGAVEGEQQVAVVYPPRFSIRIPWKPILALIVVVGGGFAGFKFVTGRSPASVAQAYLSAVLVGDTGQIQKWTVSGGGALLPTQVKLDKFELQAPASVQDSTADVSVMLYLTPDTGMISKGVNVAEHAQTLADAMAALKKPVTTTIALTKDQGRWKVDEMGSARRLNADLKKKLPEGLLERLGKVPQTAQSAGALPGVAGALGAAAPAAPAAGIPSAPTAGLSVPGAPGAPAAGPAPSGRRGLFRRRGSR